MIEAFMDECPKIEIGYVQAPFEADGQLIHLLRVNLIDAIVTEDSDFLAYGSRATIFKLQLDSSCDFIEHKDIYKCLVHKNSENNSSLTEIEAQNNFIDNFLVMCILCGCDYLDNYPNFGIMSVVKILIKEQNKLDSLKSLYRYIRGLSLSTKLPTDFVNYIANVKTTIKIFKHMVIYN